MKSLTKALKLYTIAVLLPLALWSIATLGAFKSIEQYQETTFNSGHVADFTAPYPSDNDFVREELRVEQRAKLKQLTGGSDDNKTV